MDFNLQALFESLLLNIKNNPSETIFILMGFMSFLVILMLWTNRQSASDKRIKNLTQDLELNKSSSRNKSRNKSRKSNPGLPRFFQEHKNESTQEETLVSPLVLVVDDSKTALLAATQALEGAPYRIKTALDGRVAWEKMIEERPALVITDLEMPGVDGIELLRRMRGDLRFLDVPVVLVTAHPFSSIKEGRENGVNGFLAKPYLPTELREQVAFFLRNAY